jgi:Na+/proline symporter
MNTLAPIDWGIIAAFFVVSLIIGLLTMKKAGSSSAEFFLSGRSMPWWLLGVSMVATTFSADTPNLVTDIVRNGGGVAGNWAWWAFLLTGMLTVFVYARLWRRSGVMTDLGFYELRYSGKEAAFLRGFRALYLGVLINVLIMATVCLAAAKLGAIMLGLSQLQTLLIAGVVTVIYSTLGGLRGVIITDFFQFIIAMVGSVWATITIVNMPEVGGMTALLTHDNVVGSLNFFPDINNTELFISIIIIPLAVQWWGAWYPGSEPGGGGYVAQRMLSAKNENHAVAATLFYNIAHYALRPWPWLLIALASLVVFPDLASIEAAFPGMNVTVGHDLAYPAMLTYLPAGLLGLVMASLIAAFMSTISTHLNWGASYVVSDFYTRFINKEASDKKQVWVGQLTTVGLMILAGLLSYKIDSAKDGFDLIILAGAGTGSVFIMRWFWYRINAFSEITAMVVSFVIAILWTLFAPEEAPSWLGLCLSVFTTTAAWIIVTLLTKPSEKETLINYYKLIRPFGKGWKKLGLNEDELEAMKTRSLPGLILCMFLACIMVYAALFGTGKLIYGELMASALLFALAIVSALGVFLVYRKS